MQQEATPSRKKPFFPVNPSLRQYLKTHGRETALPVSYKDLLNISYSVPLTDKTGKDTLWEKALYEMRDWNYLKEGLINLYAILKTEGDYSYTKHLDVARIDYCTFGNSNPFRIRIVNRYNDNYDHYYIKKEDASRIYGLELEDMLSPNRMTYLTTQDTLVEEHIPGIPGDVFIKDYMARSETNKIRIAKEFVKFNERCFLRLLGDMRSYNFVVAITPDIEDYQYRIRAIDFDQQSYEGRKNLYLPQFFKENHPYVDLSLKHLNSDSMEQYRAEERTLVAYRVAASRYRLNGLAEDYGARYHINRRKAQATNARFIGAFSNDGIRPLPLHGRIGKANVALCIEALSLPHPTQPGKDYGLITEDEQSTSLSSF